MLRGRAYFRKSGHISLKLEYSAGGWGLYDYDGCVCLCVRVCVCWPGPPTTSSSFDFVAKVCCCAGSVLLVVFVIDPCCLRGLTGCAFVLFPDFVNISGTGLALLDELLPHSPADRVQALSVAEMGCTFFVRNMLSCRRVPVSLCPLCLRPRCSAQRAGPGFLKSVGCCILCLQSMVVPFCY